MASFVGRIFTVKKTKGVEFVVGEEYDLDHVNPQGERTLKCKCVGYSQSLNEYSFKVMEVEEHKSPDKPL